jgi:xanthine dehydrogenase YagS FAD-binding subunit
MKRFEHFNARTIDEASSLLTKYKGEAKVNAGGTDLINVLKDDFFPTYPRAIINLKTIPGLDYIREEKGTLKIGALATLADMGESAIIKQKWSILTEAALSVATTPIRNYGTLGGNLCQDVRCWYFRASKSSGRVFHCLRKGGTTCFAIAGDNRYNCVLNGKRCFAVCQSDTAIALTALNATIITNQRSIPINEFYKTLGNDLGEGEIVTGIYVPTPEKGAKQTWIKFRQRKSLEFATVSVASVIKVSDRKVTDARIVLGAVSPVPYCATKAVDVIKGQVINEDLATKAGDASVAGAKPLSHNAYKIQIAKTLVKRALLT